MTQYVLASLCGIALAGSVYMAGWGGVSTRSHAPLAEDCCCMESTVLVATTNPSTAPGGTDVKNTKCIVMPNDTAGSLTVSHNGKLYHVCCEDCVAPFNKEPEKYVKALEADPAKFGIKK